MASSEPAGRFTSSEPKYLDTLPLDILEHICESLAACDLRKTNLFSFSLVNKACAVASSRQRFRALRITADGEEHLSNNLARLSETLDNLDRRALVRQITICGSSNTSPDAQKGSHFRDEDPEAVDGGLALSHGRYFNAERRETRRYYNPRRYQTFEDKERLEAAWRPLADFIQKLPGLADVIYEVREAFPRCILDAAQRLGPRCRLHIHTFSLESLRDATTERLLANPDAVALATSPNLCSVVVARTNYGRSPGQDDSPDLLQLVCQLAPNLRHVWMTAHHPANQPFGFVPVEKRLVESAVGSRKARLESMAFDGGETDYIRLFHRLSGVNLACLTALELWTTTSAESVGQLAELAKDAGLPALRTLAIRVDADEGLETRDTAMYNLLAALRPLEHLAVENYMGPAAFMKLLENHGGTLRRLALDWRPREFPAESYIHQICSYCRRLTQLSVPIQRMMGRRQETRLYQTLAELRYIARLTLRLVVSPHGLEYTLEEADGLTKRQRAKLLYRTLVNAAIDEPLARSIFKYMCRVNDRHGGDLQYLKIEPRGLRDLPELDEYEVLTAELADYLSNGYICERDYRALEGIRVTALKDDSLCDAEILSEMAAAGGLSDRIWRRIWPDREGDWMTKCASWPLVTDDEMQMPTAAAQ